MSNPIQARLTADMKAAMKAKDKDRLQVIRLLIADLKSAQHNLGRDELEEGEELDVLRKAVKSRRDAIEQAEKVERHDVVERETAELEVIQEYLPAMMSGDELVAKVREVAAEIGYTGPKDTGKFMKEWMARYKGRAEGRDVQAAIKQL